MTKFPLVIWQFAELWCMFHCWCWSLLASMHRGQFQISPRKMQAQRVCRPSKSPTPIPVAAPAACREGVGEIPSDAWYTDGSSPGHLCTWSSITIQPQTETICMETGMNCSCQWDLASDHSWALTINPLHWLMGCSKGINSVAWTMEAER